MTLSLPKAVRDRLAAAQRLLVLTGAGISAESGVSTFRQGAGGLWQRFDPAQLATPEAFADDPARVWGWYEWRRAGLLRAQPNAGHVALAGLLARAGQGWLVTQNVDDLHERAGSPAVVHLHGRLDRARCASCGAPYAHAPELPVMPDEGMPLMPPRCSACTTGLIRPGVVWFGESLPQAAWRQAQQAALQCEAVLCVGTSALVHPAASLPALAQQQGACLVVVNPAPTPVDDMADAVLRGAAGTLLPALLALLQAQDDARH